MKHPKYNGQLLLFVARDGNNTNIDLAIALVPSEDQEQYTWFLSHIKKAAGVAAILNRPATVIISDRDKGISAALFAELRSAHQSKCFVHILRNVNSHLVKKKLPRLGRPQEGLAWAVCKASTMAEFDSKMQALEACNPGMFDTLI